MCMNRLTRLLVVLVLAVAGTVTASAQFSIGPRIGLNVNKMHFNSSVLDTDNCAGFVGGVEMEFMLPVIGFGFDLSLLYVHQSSDSKVKELDEESFEKKDYIEIPLNLKYKISFPIISKFVKPYFFTGPSIAFLTSRKAISEAYHNKKVDYSWNLGFGVEVLNHLQVSAHYGIGLNNTLEKLDVNAEKIDCKSRSWTITAAYLF